MKFAKRAIPRYRILGSAVLCLVTACTMHQKQSPPTTLMPATSPAVGQVAVHNSATQVAVESTSEPATQAASRPSTLPSTMPAAPVIKDGSTSPLAISSQMNVPFSYSILPKINDGAINAVSTYEAQDLPAGLNFNSNSGVISGAPKDAGTFRVPITATNGVGTGTGTLVLTVYPEHPTTATTIMRFKGTTESPFGYVEFLPSKYYVDSQRTFPVVIDLCGAGNIAGKDSDPWSGNAQNKLWELSYQAGRLNKTGSKIFDEADCIILSPIPPTWWENVPLDQFFKFAYAHYRIDRSRVYLVGLSAGGDGTLDYVAAHDSDIAACVVSAFSHDKPQAHRDWKPFLHTPIWIFENWRDPFDNSRGESDRRHTIQFCNKIAALLSGAAAPTDMLANYPGPDLSTIQPTRDFTGIYTVSDGWKWTPGVNAIDGPPLRLTQCKTKGHGGWNQAYGDPDVWKWVFAQHKVSATTMPRPETSN